MRLGRASACHGTAQKRRLDNPLEILNLFTLVICKLHRSWGVNDRLWIRRKEMGQTEEEAKSKRIKAKKKRKRRDPSSPERDKKGKKERKRKRFFFLPKRVSERDL